jgi:hypothetical protein
MGHATGSKYELGYLKDFLFSQGNNPREEQKSKQNIKKKIKTFKIGMLVEIGLVGNKVPLSLSSSP